MFNRKCRGAFFHTEVGLPEGDEPLSAALAPPLPAELVERKAMVPRNLGQRLGAVGFDRARIPLIQDKVFEQAAIDSDPTQPGTTREGGPRWVTVELGHGMELRVRRPFI